ncbi:hypothetical protein CR513_41601, partial [Mucuna pruriens]
WCIIFVVTLDNIWKCRNEWVFESRSLPLLTVASHFWKQADGVAFVACGVLRDHCGSVIFAFGANIGSWCRALGNT